MSGNWDDEDDWQAEAGTTTTTTASTSSKSAKPAAAVKPKGWDDEEEGWEDEGEVKESWEEDTEEAQQARKEKEKAERAAKKAAEEEKRKGKQGPPKPAMPKFETAEEEARYRQTMVEESDMRLAEDMFGASGTGGESSVLPRVELVRPGTFKEFSVFADRLGGVVTQHAQSKHYPGFVQALIKNIVGPLSMDDMQRIVQSVTAIHNEKVQEDKKKRMGGKKKAVTKRPNLAADAVDDLKAFGSGEAAVPAALDDDDFM